MNVDLKKAAGVNHARLTLDIDGLSYSIVFKSGGVTESPCNVNAAAGGGLVHEGLYDPWLIEGEVSVSKDMAKWLLQAYQNRPNARKTSGVYELYSTTDQMIIKHQFDNVCVHKIPHLAFDSLGSQVNMSISFSLNDYIGSQVIDA